MFSLRLTQIESLSMYEIKINPPLEWGKLQREIVSSSSLAALKNAIFNISDFLLLGVFVTVIAIAF